MSVVPREIAASSRARITPFTRPTLQANTLKTNSLGFGKHCATFCAFLSSEECWLLGWRSGGRIGLRPLESATAEIALVQSLSWGDSVLGTATHCLNVLSRFVVGVAVGSTVPSVCWGGTARSIAGFEDVSNAIA